MCDFPSVFNSTFNIQQYIFVSTISSPTLSCNPSHPHATPSTQHQQTNKQTKMSHSIDELIISISSLNDMLRTILIPLQQTGETQQQQQQQQQQQHRTTTT